MLIVAISVELSSFKCNVQWNLVRQLSYRNTMAVFLLSSVADNDFQGFFHPVLRLHDCHDSPLSRLAGDLLFKNAVDFSGLTVFAFLPLWAVLRNNLAAEVHGQDITRL